MVVGHFEPSQSGLDGHILQLAENRTRSRHFKATTWNLAWHLSGCRLDEFIVWNCGKYFFLPLFHFFQKLIFFFFFFYLCLQLYMLHQIKMEIFCLICWNQQKLPKYWDCKLLFSSVCVVENPKSLFKWLVLVDWIK